MGKLATTIGSLLLRPTVFWWKNNKERERERPLEGLGQGKRWRHTGSGFNISSRRRPFQCMSAELLQGILPSQNQQNMWASWSEAKKGKKYYVEIDLSLSSSKPFASVSVCFVEKSSTDRGGVFCKTTVESQRDEWLTHTLSPFFSFYSFIFPSFFFIFFLFPHLPLLPPPSIFHYIFNLGRTPWQEITRWCTAFGGGWWGG